ncbi:MAG TPA: beta-phosphoglucomutase family hydrolase, partial [Salinimicrobium catena]|nr:beta-phosphoglucomutase family hydrolase [Salinimicrobium catena]
MGVDRCGQFTAYCSNSVIKTNSKRFLTTKHIEMKYAIRAAILDLDGVLTQTASQHARAWKMAFDNYNAKRKEKGEEPFKPFEIDKDYPEHIDGIPRYDGVSAFLKSRSIELPFGSPEDDKDKETVCGIGNLKNGLYQKLISEEGVKVCEKNVATIRSWKKQGIKTAVISSSKNCKKILELAGLTDLFEVRVDGITSEEKNIPGKPAPDIFLEAARQLDVPPQEALIVEDAQAGVEAGRKGEFRLVIGIKNASNESELLEKGADVVVNNLEELHLEFKKRREARVLPSALKCFGQLVENFKDVTPLLFLDFDGTLSPIVEHHEDAEISEEMRSLVRELSKKYPVAVVSGRGLS